MLLANKYPSPNTSTSLRESDSASSLGFSHSLGAVVASALKVSWNSRLTNERRMMTNGNPTMTLQGVVLGHDDKGNANRPRIVLEPSTDRA